MKRLGFIYEIDKCIGCKACQVACKDKNHLGSGAFFRRVETIECQGVFVHFSGGCNHCEDAACIKVCPTQAMNRENDQTVGHDSGKCMGCGACIWSCPYGAVKFSNEKGIAQKCNSCSDLRSKGEKPACVQSCITHCLDFNEIESLDGKNHPNFLPSETLTKPSLVMIEGRVSS